MTNEFPIILFGKEYRKELLTHIEIMKVNEMISEHELNSLFVTDSVEEIVNYLQTYSVKKIRVKENTFQTKMVVVGTK